MALGKIVVTGGAGFIGSHLVDRLLESDTDVVVFDSLARGRLENLAHHYSDPRFQFIHGDVRDEQAVRETLRGARVVYHLAAQPSVVGAVKNARLTFETNVMGTFNVLRAATDHGVERVLFASSRQVYGEPIGLPVD